MTTNYKPKIYLAAAWKRRDEMRGVRDTLQSIGYIVTSRWLDVPTELDKTSTGALLDLRDIDDCDVLLLWAETKGAGYMTGGRHFETGYAVRAGKAVFVIGDPESIFHSLPQVRCVPTVLEALKLI